MTAAVPASGWHVANSTSDSVVIGALVQGQTVHMVLPHQITPALGGMPRPAAVFTGRESDLKTMLQMLDPRGPGKTMAVSAVAGMAGVGKTELVLQAARHALARGWFPGGVLFADLLGYDLQRRMTAADVLAGWLAALGVPGEHIPSSEQDRARLWRTIIEAYATEDRRLLLVIDNAADAAQVTPLLPTNTSIPVLVTSRHILDLDARLHSLRVLDTDPAVELISQVIALRCGPDDPRFLALDHHETLGELVVLCEGLPLALRIVAALLADRPHLTPSVMVASLRSEHERLDQISRRETTGEVAVRAAFDLSYQHLTTDQARIFRLLPANPGPTISTEAAAHLADLTHTEVGRLLRDLHRAHLVDETELARWQQHDLLRLYATTQQPDMPDEGTAARERLLAYYLSTARDADSHLVPSMPPPASSTFANRDRALEWLDTERLNLISAAFAAAAVGDHTTTIGFFDSLTQYLHLQRFFNDAIALAERALAASRVLPSRKGEGAALSNLGAALQKMRRFDEAISIHKQAAIAHHQAGDSRSRAATLSNLGGAFRELRRFDDAITALQQAADLYQELDDHHGNGVVLNNLGSALQEAGQPTEAVAALLQAAAIFKTTNDRNGEAMALNNLGSALLRVGNASSATITFKRAVAIYQSVTDRHSEGIALNNLGGALQAEERFGEAITVHREAITIYKETEDRRGEGIALNSLGLALQEVQSFEESIAAHKEAVAIFQEIQDRRAEGEALNNLGIALLEVQSFEEARECLAEASRASDDTGDDSIAALAIGLLAHLDRLER